MKKLLLAAVAASGLAATPAMAADYVVSGTIAPACGALADGTITFAGGIATDAATGALSANQSASTTTTGYCNGVGSKISVSVADAFDTPTTTADAGFTSTLLLSPTVTYGATVFPVGNNQTIGAFSGTLTISTGNLAAAGGLKPVAGNYTGTIAVTLTPSN